jgi:hypothetical protein
MSARCLNCETQLIDKFCHHCGQKASTHRITFNKFVSHDLPHGLFHLDRGIIYTIRNLLLRPGYAAKSFISGQRIRHYNIFALFVIMIACKAILDLYNDTEFVFQSKDHNPADAEANKILQNYYKVIYLVWIPTISIFTWTLLRRLKYYYTEHIVLNGFILTGAFFYSLIFTLAGLLIKSTLFKFIGIVAVLLYIMVGYYQATKGTYSFFAYLWRTALCILFFVMVLFIVLKILVDTFYEGGFIGNFG